MLCRPKHRTMNIFGTQINPSKLTNSVDLWQISPRILMQYDVYSSLSPSNRHSRDEWCWLWNKAHYVYEWTSEWVVRQELQLQLFYTMQKESLSDMLSSISSGRAPTHSNCDTLTLRETSNPRSVTALSSNNFMSSGFISNSSFNNCTFQFTNPQN